MLILCLADEEIGGLQGMGKLIRTEDFKQLNVGFALDEGMPTQSDEFFVFYAERTSWSRLLYTVAHIILMLYNMTPKKKIN